MKKIIFVILLLSISNISFSQNKLYMPKEIRDAYDSETRSFDGKPGKKYWQNFVDYNLKINVSIKNKKVKGKAEIVYHNKSPHTMSYVFFKLHQDLYKKGVKREKIIDEEDLHDGTIVKNIFVDNQEISSDNIHQEGTMLRIKLPKLKISGSKINIKIEWTCFLPSETNIRMGIYDDQDFFAGYCFPQIAVFDDINKWNTNSYNGLHEHYNEYSNFNVEIKVPEDYVVWASGVLQNPEEVLEKEFYKRYQKSKKSNKVVKIISNEDLANKAKITKKRIWKFKAENINDFAFCGSKRFLWDAVSLKLKNKEERISINAVYPKKAKDFEGVANISKKTIDYLSNIYPAINYPYPQMTTFCGGPGGMEYPMMANNASCFRRSETIHVTTHEIAHTYFPFMVGTNQEKYAWMDEGWAMQIPAILQYELEPREDQEAYSALMYSWFAGSEKEMPPMILSYFTKGYEYYITNYYRAELSFRFLREILGEDIFLKALQTFVEEWKGKHPTPWDMFFSFGRVSNKKLAWYWKSWLYEHGEPDLGIKNVKKILNRYSITIEKIGNIPVPINLKIFFKDDTELLIRKSAEVWKDKNECIIERTFSKSVKKIELGHPHIPDTQRSNNYYSPKNKNGL